tara:strand:- start:5337 stop:5675 length:339 start_codon:yes stop_codon:yes gene_type:complete
MTKPKANCIKVYFRRATEGLDQDDPDKIVEHEWQLESTWPAITINKITCKNKSLRPGSFESPSMDPNEGKAAMQVLNNIKNHRLESYYRFEYDEDNQRVPSKTPITYEGTFD